MIDILSRGGFMMVPILLGSVLGLAIIIERFWSLQRSRVLPKDYLARMEKMLAQDKRSEALSACKENNSHVARILLVGLENRDQTRAEITEALELAGRKESAALSQWIGSLGVIASLEPLMGLLGTVLGLIEAFQQIERLKVVGDPSVVASGVWQAMLTTAAGLVIAIPTFAFYHYFQCKVTALVMEMETNSFKMLQMLTSSSKKNT